MLTKLRDKHHHTLQLAPNISVSFIGLIKKKINNQSLYYILYHISSSSSFSHSLIHQLMNQIIYLNSNSSQDENLAEQLENERKK